MKKTVLSVFLFLFVNITFAQTKQIKEVEKSVEELCNAMINADSMALYKLVSSKLSYGHSGGAVDDKNVFIQKLVSGKSDFVSMGIKDQTIVIAKKTAIVRHILNATTNDSGKAGEVHLKVMLVWIKQNSKWRLIGRQAIKN